MARCKEGRSRHLKIAVYGGSFNPPHRAHGLVAEWLISSGTVDEVWLVPVYRHALARTQDKVLAPFCDRVAWCEAMAKEHGPGLKLSQVESRLPSPSYTIDTLEHLSERHPQHQFRLVVGADILAQVDAWKDWARISTLYSPIVLGREGYPSPGDLPVFPAVSSTEIRKRLRAGKSVEGLVSQSVFTLLQQGHPWGVKSSA
jgi:nicotinate-nucleotide adenylyltransferase